MSDECGGRCDRRERRPESEDARIARLEDVEKLVRCIIEILADLDLAHWPSDYSLYGEPQWVPSTEWCPGSAEDGVGAEQDRWRGRTGSRDGASGGCAFIDFSSGGIDDRPDSRPDPVDAFGVHDQPGHPCGDAHWAAPRVGD